MDTIPDAPGQGTAVAARRRPDWVARGTLAALLLATGVLYIAGLSASGYANSFYSAAAQAGSQNWEAWFYGSLDGGNSITVDKPPASLWIMGLSVRLFGLSSWSILVPEALLGVASVGVLYASLRRTLRLGWVAPITFTERQAHWAALAGAATMALTPAGVLMFRFNNPDALLVFCLTLASYFTVRACERASRRHLVYAGIAIGFGFLTKMLQAFVILPALVVAYLVAAPATWKKKLVDLLAAFAAVIVSAGWYVAIVELMPTSMRPYIGGSQTNSFLELAIGYNGLGRITGDEVGSVGAQRGPGVGTESLTRLFSGVSGGMISWLIPAALILGAGALVLLFRRTEGRPKGRLVEAGLVAWGGSLVITAVVFSLMGGIYHDYYTVALAPFIGATVALGGAVAWAHRTHWAGRGLLALASLATGGWALVLLRQAGGWYAMLGYGALGLAVVSAAALLLGDRFGRTPARLALAGAVIASLAGPAAYAVNTAQTPHTGSIVTAGPVSSNAGRAGGGFGGRVNPGNQGNQANQGNQGTNRQGQPPGGGTGNAGGSNRGTTNTGGAGQGGMGGLLNGASVSSELAATLTQDASAYTWIAASVGSQNAASYQLATGYAVMAIGGFNGSDPSPTLEQFKQLVAEGRIHYFVGGGSFGGQNGGSRAASAIASWVSSTYTAKTVGGTTVYDLTQAT